MIIAIVGLKYFGNRICEQLNKIDNKNKYIYFNTYYSYKDRLCFLILLPFIKTVYSINGTIKKSFIFNISFFLKKKVVFHWVGSDLTQAKKDFLDNNYNHSFIAKPIHLTDTPWYIDELKTIGIKAQFIPLTTVNENYTTRKFPNNFSVLSYIPELDSNFYGFDRIIDIANNLKHIHFVIAGISKTNKIIPENIKLLGWVNNMEEIIANSIVSLRIPEHDGLSSFIIESLKNERYVLYNIAYNECVLIDDNQSIIDAILLLEDKFNCGNLPLNTKGRNFVLTNFSEKAIINNIIFVLTNNKN